MCETALGKEPGGRGAGWFDAGVSVCRRTLSLVSLWSVADESTAYLMSRFYRYLKAGKTKDAALRAAQLDLIRSRRFFHPFHWAAFTLTGDWR